MKTIRAFLPRDNPFQTLLILSLVLGVLVGIFGAVFTVIWHAVDHFVWSHLTHNYDKLWLSPLAGLIIGLIFSALRDPGSMSTLIHHFHDTASLPYEDNAPIVPASLIGLIAGQSAGPEGILTQVCGTLGRWVSERMQQLRLKRILTLAGMGAGFGAFLGAPVGGAILWLEMLHARGLEYYEAIIPTVLTSVVGYLMMAVFTGSHLTPMWHYTPFAPTTAVELLEPIGIGFVCAAVVVVYAWIFRKMGRVFHKIKSPIYVRTTLAGLAIGILGYFFPLTYFYGAAQVSTILQTSFPLIAILLMLLVKMLACSVTVKGHWQGGLIIPHMFMGALVGKAIAMVVPGVNPTLAMVTAMAAFNAAATQTPLASALIVIALTGYASVIHVFIASLCGFLMGQRIVLIENKRPRTEAHNFHLEPVLQK